MMRKSAFAIMALALMFLGSGCATGTRMARSYPAIKPVPPPTAGHKLKTDNLLVISDISRSMRCDNNVGTEKALLTSFNQGIPKGLKNAGMRTFGKSAYYHTVLVQPVAKYDRGAMANSIGDLEARWGNTPLASALVKARGDLEEATGNLTILLVSDGENPLGDPINAALALKETYGDRLCIHTIHVGDSASGRETMNHIATLSGCGIAAVAANLESESGMNKFITDVFFSHDAKDSDGDGVLDYNDKCPGTPRGVKVDDRGCPIDSDGDGVPDYKDKCPGTPKGVKVDNKGCPLDSDGDGVPDRLDKCPNTPKGVKVDKVGCPLDGDDDGVADYLDKCPNTPKGATVNSVGCWVIKGILFDYNKADIKPEYQDRVDNAVRILNLNPTMKVEIDGHTDGIGSDAYNQPLSEKRAEAVKDALVAAGIEKSRITARGFGKQQPIATNETPEGRAKNRRIKVKILSR
jgi:OOP family OmpA-OmpF porin